MIIQFLFRKHSYICTRTKYIIVDPKDVCCSIFIKEHSDNKCSLSFYICTVIDSFCFSQPKRHNLNSSSA